MKVYNAHTHEHLPGVPTQDLIDTGGKVVYARHRKGMWVRVPANALEWACRHFKVKAVYVL